MPSTTKLFQDYKKDIKIFIETGSHVGSGIMNAIKAGFEEIHSIELQDNLFERCKDRFKNFRDIFLYHGDSRSYLELILQKIDKPCLIWLDAHFSGGETGGNNDSPLYKELEIIKRYGNYHTVLIDDIRSEDNILLIDTLKSINPNYKITFEDSYQGNKLLFEKDIICASL